ncbi:hypothetical protein NDU88_007878, partial [Pleurodeles waltl]
MVEPKSWRNSSEELKQFLDTVDISFIDTKEIPEEPAASNSAKEDQSSEDNDERRRLEKVMQ